MSREGKETRSCARKRKHRAGRQRWSDEKSLCLQQGSAQGLQTRAKRVCVSRDHMSSCVTLSERNQSCQCQPLASNIFSPQSCISHIPEPEVNFPKIPNPTNTTFLRKSNGFSLHRLSWGFSLKSGWLFRKSQKFLLRKRTSFQRQLTNSPPLQPCHCSWATTTGVSK